MKRSHVLIGAALAAFAASPAASANETQVCVKGPETRTVEAITPGEVGAACDMRLTIETGADRSVTTPFHANNQSDFCAQKARETMARLVSQGFDCAPPGEAPGLEFDTSDARLPAPGSARAPAPEPTRATTRTAAAATVPATAVGATTVSAASVSGTAVSGTAGSGTTGSATGRARATAAPAPQAAAPSAEPSRATPANAVPAKPRPAASTGEGDAPTDAESADAKAAAPVDRAPYRPQEAAALIRGVLDAQQAAWNEGDIEAFMAAYWNSPKLRLVSGTTVTKGWKKILRRYRDRYGDNGDFGVLAFSGVDVTVLEDDVALVVGRYAVDQGGPPATGAFSLVMKRFDGLWRIVHDHSAADPVEPVAAPASTPAEPLTEE